MKTSIRMINKIFKIRSCKYFIDDEVIMKKKIKVCLDYHIKKCDGPCEGLVSEHSYNKMVDQVVKLLKGKSDQLIKELAAEMREASDKFHFEEAAELRDKIEHLQVYSNKQKIVSNDFDDKDVISAAVEGKDVAATILNIRGGKLVGKRQFHLSADLNDQMNQILSSLIKFYYSEFVEVPKEILIGKVPDEKGSLLNWLNTKSDRKVRFNIPIRKVILRRFLKCADKTHRFS